MNSVRIMSEEGGEEETLQGFDSGNNRISDGGDAIVRTVSKCVLKKTERGGEKRRTRRTKRRKCA